MTAPLDTAGLVAELKARLEKRRASIEHEIARGWTDKFENGAAWATLTVPFNELAAIFDALTAKDSELAEARAASDAAAYDLVAGWHERQAKLFREMADDEPRTAEPARKRATEAAIHHAASAAALRNRAITERRARTVLSREKEA